MFHPLPNKSAQVYAEAKARRETEARATLARAAKTFVGKIPGADAESLITFMRETGRRYMIFSLMAKLHGDTKRAKKDLTTLAEASDALLNAAQSIGEGAQELMARAMTPYKEHRQFQDNIRMALGGEGIDPLGQDPIGDQWMEGLWGLRDEANAALSLLAELTSRGGRKSLGDRLEGSPEERLAWACKEFAEANGCASQAVALKMVRAIMEAEKGKDAMTRLNGKPAASKGRKAVRKVAQTSPKPGTV